MPGTETHLPHISAGNSRSRSQSFAERGRPNSYSEDFHHSVSRDLLTKFDRNGCINLSPVPAGAYSPQPASNFMHDEPSMPVVMLQPCAEAETETETSANVINLPRSLHISEHTPHNAAAVAVVPSPPFKDKSEMQKQAEMAIWSGFFKKTLRERQDQIRLVYPMLDMSVLQFGGLEANVADVMVENCIGVAALPIGVAPNFIVNGKPYVVPMSVEEPSVIAAASGVAKLVSGCGGFTAVSTDNVMTAQVQLCDWRDRASMIAAVEAVHLHQNMLCQRANTFCESMAKRGGGVVGIQANLVEPRRPRLTQPHGFVVVHIDINVCEAMGANIANTVAEGIAPILEELTHGRVGLKILTNLCKKRVTKCSFRLPLDQLKWKGVEGRVVAERIVEAYCFADDDEHRAATHNKGVCNGMDAVALALGQDWRAIEAAAHSSVHARLGYYGPLTTYVIHEDTQSENGIACLHGEIELPMAVGTKGGALQTHPLYRFTHALLGNPDAQTVGQIICAVGLAQNFAAMRALAIEGIQRGHMGLHARNIAVAAGVPNALVSEVAAYMVSRHKINIDTAKEYLTAHSIYNSATGPLPVAAHAVTPSTLYIELCIQTGVDGSEAMDSTGVSVVSETVLSLNVAFASLGPLPVHLSLVKNHEPHPLQQQLFGSNKGFAWYFSGS